MFAEPDTQHHVAVDHGREPAQPRHVDEPQHLQHPPALGQDRPAGQRPVLAHRPAHRLRHGPRGGHVQPPPARRPRWWPTPSTAATPRPSGTCPKATSTTSRSPACTRSRSSASSPRATSTFCGPPTTTGPSRCPTSRAFLGKRRARRASFDAFIVVSEVYPTLSTQYADVVFPAAMWVEREGQFGNGERRTAVFEKAVRPAGRGQVGRCGCSWRWPNACSTARQIDGEDAFDRLFGDMVRQGRRRLQGRRSAR